MRHKQGWALGCRSIYLSSFVVVTLQLRAVFLAWPLLRQIVNNSILQRLMLINSMERLMFSRHFLLITWTYVVWLTGYVCVQDSVYKFNSLVLRPVNRGWPGAPTVTEQSVWTVHRASVYSYKSCGFLWPLSTYIVDLGWDEFSPDAPDALLFTSSRSQKKTLLSVFEFRLRSSNALGPIHVGCL